MKEHTVKLRCATCADEDFEFNEDKTYIKCNRCGREYFGGYDELLEYNQEAINDSIDEIKTEASDYIKKSLTDALKGCKNIKLQ